MFTGNDKPPKTNLKVYPHPPALGGKVFKEHVQRNQDMTKFKGERSRSHNWPIPTNNAHHSRTL